MPIYKPKAVPRNITPYLQEITDTTLSNARSGLPVKVTWWTIMWMAIMSARCRILETVIGKITTTWLAPPSGMNPDGIHPAGR